MYDAVALGISIDNSVVNGRNNQCPFCSKSEKFSALDPGCRDTFKNVHKEADLIAELVLKRFDHWMISLKNPSLEQLTETFKAIRQRMTRGQQKAFMFSFTGHAAQIKNSLHCLLHADEVFDVERELRMIS